MDALISTVPLFIVMTLFVHELEDFLGIVVSYLVGAISFGLLQYIESRKIQDDH